jgi:hypothetical protein
MPTYTVAIRGTKFRPPEAREVAKHLTPHESVLLEPEPKNPYDENAIKIIVKDQFIGFVQADIAAVLSPILQGADHGLAAYVSEERDTSGLHFIEVTV